MNALFLLILLTGCDSTTTSSPSNKSQPTHAASSTTTSSSSNKSQSTSATTVSQTYLGAGTSLDISSRFHMVTSQVGWARSVKDYLKGPLFRTTDGGKSWQQIILPSELSGKYFWVYVFDEEMAFLQPIQPAGAGTALLYFYRTVDGGKTWQRCNWPTTPLTAKYGIETSSWTFLDHMHGWVMTPLPDPSMTRGGNDRTPPPSRDETLFHTDNGGQSWQLVSHLPLKYAGSQLTFIDAHTGFLVTSIDDPAHPAPTDPHAFPAALYVTHDGGSTWKQSSALPLPAQETARPGYLYLRDFFNLHDGCLIAPFVKNAETGTDTNYLYTTQDGGKTWQVNGAALPANIAYPMHIVDAMHIDDGTFLFTLTNGQWVKTSSAVPGGNNPVRAEFLSSQVGLALLTTTTSETNVYRTDDGGKHWKEVGTLPQGS